MDYKYLIVRAEDFSSIDPSSYYLEPRFSKDKTLVLIQPIEPPRDNFITHEEALKNAPKKDSDYFRIPKVLDK